jgi:uncharacterized protein HemX
MKAEMEAPDIAAIITAVGGLAGGLFGGIKIGKSRQVEEIKELINQYKDANEFTKSEVLDVKNVLNETRQMHQECEDGRRALACRVDELELHVKTIVSGN